MTNWSPPTVQLLSFSYFPLQYLKYVNTLDSACHGHLETTAMANIKRRGTIPDIQNYLKVSQSNDSFSLGTI